MHKIKLYIWLLLIGLGISAIGLGIVIFSLPPLTAVNIALFYFSGTLVSFFSFLLIGFYLRRIFGMRELYNQYFAPAARQALWLTLILIGSFALLSQDLFSWVNAGLLVGACIFFEFFLASRHNQNDRNT